MIINVIPLFPIVYEPVRDFCAIWICIKRKIDTHHASIIKATIMPSEIKTGLISISTLFHLLIFVRNLFKLTNLT